MFWCSSYLIIANFIRHYNIGYAVVSLIFVTNAIGFISAAFFVDAIRAKFGRGRTLMIAQSLMLCGYIPIICTPPFPVIIVSFFFLGVGMAIYLAMGNTFAANLVDGTKMLGAMHGSYGIGGTIGPLIATAMVTKGDFIFSRFYILCLGVALFNLFFAGWSFWHYEAEAGVTLLTPSQHAASNTQNAGPAPREESHIKDQFASMVKAFKSKTVILGALFIFAYQGAEVSISGWVISFLIATRHGNPSAVGYVTSGFWAGITLGRFLLSHPGTSDCPFYFVKPESVKLQKHGIAETGSPKKGKKHLPPHKLTYSQLTKSAKKSSSTALFSVLESSNSSSGLYQTSSEMQLQLRLSDCCLDLYIHVPRSSFQDLLGEKSKSVL